jgi:hypothetical protein
VKQALFQLRTERSSNALSIDDLEQKLKKYNFLPFASSSSSSSPLRLTSSSPPVVANRMNAKMNHATVEAILLEKLEDTICYLKEAGQIFHLV